MAERKQGEWIERTPSGERLFCFRVRVRGKSEVRRYTLRELEKKIKEDV